MHCISSSKPCVVGNGDPCHGQSKMETQAELVTWVFLWNTFIPLSLMINFAPVPCKIGCELCPAQAVGRGAWPWLHTLLPFHPASTTRGTEGNVKLLFHIRWLLLRGKARLWGSVLLRMGNSEGCFSQPNPPLCSRAWPWQRKAPAQGQTLPHPVAASAHLALEGARINAKTNPDWGHFTQTTEWKLSTLTVYIFPPKYLFCCLFSTNRTGYIQVLHSQSLLMTFLFLPHCQVLEGTKSYPQTLSFVPICHHWNGKAMVIDKMFHVGELEFCLSSPLPGLGSWFLYTQCTRPAKPQLCLPRTDLKGRQPLIFASRFWTLATQRIYLKCNIKPLKIFMLSSDISSTLNIFSLNAVWFLLFITFLIISFSLLLLRMVELQCPNCYTQGCEFIILNYSLVYLVSLFYIKHSFKWFSLYWHFIMPS